MARKRKKSDSSASYSFQGVACKLNTVCRVPFLRAELQRTAAILKHVSMLGWKIVGMHVLRCLEAGSPPTDLGYSLFYRCCTVSRAEIERKHRAAASPAYPDLQPTLTAFWELDDQISSHATPSLTCCDSMVAMIAMAMETNTSNMLALHFRRRLHQYIRFRYAKEGKVELGYKSTKKLVDSCYRVKEVPVLDSDGVVLGMDKLWSEWDEPRTPVERELRAWLGAVPWEWQIREDLPYFLVKVYDMLKFMEAFVADHPETKGARLYSLLPYSSSFVPAHVTVNISSLFEVFSRLRHDPEVQRFVHDELQMSMNYKDRPKWTEHRDAIFRKIFSFEGLETATRSFAYQVTTDGYAASVLLRRVVQAPDDVEHKVDVSPRPTKKTKNNQGRAVVPKGVKQRELDAALQKLPRGYVPDVMVGIDPGVRSLCTAACVGRLPTRRERRRRNRRRKRRRKRKHRRGGQRIVDISTGEYYHLAKLEHHRVWTTGLRQREPLYEATISAMPSFKTANYATYLEGTKYFLQNLEYLLRFSAEHSFRKWRFLNYCMKKKALDTLAKRLVPTPSSQVCVGFGDWSGQSGLRGNRHAPVKAFRKALARRATVLPMDEFRTSKLCSCCHERLDQARLLTKVKDRETKETKIVLKRNRNVLRCKNSRCKAHFWNRDVNAARNILDLLKSELLGLGRLAAFQH